MSKLTYDEKNAIARGTALVVFLLGLMFLGVYYLLEYDRNKMLAFIAKCEAAGNHTEFRNMDNGACFEGPQPKLVERY